MPIPLGSSLCPRPLFPLLVPIPGPWPLPADSRTEIPKKIPNFVFAAVTGRLKNDGAARF